jgi:hypothetical protein
VTLQLVAPQGDYLFSVDNGTGVLGIDFYRQVIGALAGDVLLFQIKVGSNEIAIFQIKAKQIGSGKTFIINNRLNFPSTLHPVPLLPPFQVVI